MGKPSPSKWGATPLWRRKLARPSRSISSFPTWYRQNRPDTTWAINVAAAAPAMPHWNTITNSKSSAIFAAEATAMAWSGVFPSPRERSTQASRL